MIEADALACAEQILGHQFQDRDLLLTALTHASIADHRLKSNERLEFLGDAVLGIVICEELYRRFSNWLEGDLTKVKSAVVARRTCAKIADETGLTGLLMLGNGIEGQGKLPTSVRAAVVEAVIGALFLDGGIEAAGDFVRRSTDAHINRCAASQDQENYKSALQQYAQRVLATTPHYETLDEQGPDHSKCFEVCVVVSGRRYPSAWGTSKKDAEQEAAHRALEILQQTDDDDAES